MTSVLISGASVAGPALALQLRRHGFEVTVVERAPALRPGGQAIDIRGAALDVADRMGLLDPLRELRTHMRGMSMLDAEGNELFRSEEYAASSGRLDSPDIEVLREDLTALLHSRTVEAGVEYVFGDTVTALAESAGGVHVTFAASPARDFDLVVGADGLHSTTRRLAFGPERDYLHHLGVHLAIWSMDNILGLDDWQVWVQGPDGLGGGIYPARKNTEIRVNLGFFSGPLDYDHRDIEGQKRLVAERFHGLGWEFPRLLAGMERAPDFYFDAMAQVRMDSWSRGRVTLLGDAASCPTTLSGQGTSLALVGAYVLAEELAKADPSTAFAAYEARVRPFAEANQALATENPGGPASEESMERAKFAIEL